MTSNTSGVDRCQGRDRGVLVDLRTFEVVMDVLLVAENGSGQMDLPHSLPGEGRRGMSQVEAHDYRRVVRLCALVVAIWRICGVVGLPRR